MRSYYVSLLVIFLCFAYILRIKFSSSFILTDSIINSKWLCIILLSLSRNFKSYHEFLQIKSFRHRLESVAFSTITVIIIVILSIDRAVNTTLTQIDWRNLIVAAYNNILLQSKPCSIQFQCCNKKTKTIRKTIHRLKKAHIHINIIQWVQIIWVQPKKYDFFWWCGINFPLKMSSDR